MRFLSCLCLWLSLSAGLWAQSTALLNNDEINMLVNELSGDRSFEHIRVLSRWHRDSGMDGYFKAADYIMESAKSAGLEDVQFIEQRLNHPNYTARRAELWMVEPMEVKLADLGDHATILADGSSSADTTAEVVWIGDEEAGNRMDTDLRGKIVLTSRSAFGAVRRAVWKQGAIGVISYETSEGRSPLDFPDQIAWTRIPYDSTRPTFAFSISPRLGNTLREFLHSDETKDFFAMGKKVRGGRVVVRARIETEVSATPGRTGFVEAWIRGTKYHDQQIVLTAHLQEEQGSANDDGSGCGNILEIGRTMKKLIEEGKMQRPLRDIRFWWTDEIYSEYEWFKEHPDEPKKFLVNLHQDMVGARLSAGSRVQHLIYAPHSRRSYLDALFEDIGMYVIQTNTAFLAASRSGGFPRPFTRPIYATRGTREGYTAAFVPYFGSSDNMCFVEGIIGVPAVALINWDDSYIHSSDDDLWQIDATQLERNAFIIASLAYVLGRADGTQAPMILAVTHGQATRHFSRDVQTALQMIVRNPASIRDAELLVEQALQRGLRAIESTQVFSVNDRDFNKRIADVRAHLQKQHDDALVFIRRASNQPWKPTKEEELAARKIPSNSSSLKDYFAARQRLAVETKLHPIMRQEVFNFVDGKRSYYEIYKAVRAESISEGEWYYGSVTLDDVTRLLDAAVESGALKLR